MGEDSSNTYLYLKNTSTSAVEVRHYAPSGVLVDISGSVTNPNEAWFRHHLGNASINVTSPKADATTFKIAAESSDMVASLSTQGETELASWMTSSPQGTGWVSANGHPAAKEWAES